MKSFCPVDESNPLKTRQDLMDAFRQLADPLVPYYSEGGAQLNLGWSGYHYTDRGAWLESFSRLLWGLAPFAAGGGEHPALQYAVMGLKNGTDPRHPEYWGQILDGDQRFVEMTVIAYAILTDPRHFWDSFTPMEQENICRWLNQINERKIGRNNWYFFRVLVNLAFDKVGWPYDKAVMEDALQLIDSLYRKEGWFQDGAAGAFDYYNSYAFHFYSMIYYRERKDTDPERCARYLDYAVQFAGQFKSWFSNEGASFPFGRSQTYRFGQASSFVGAALAGVEVIPWGECKGIVLRHLRSWLKKPIFDRDGVLSIGYGYPNLVMTEDYNAPGSPYWGFKLLGVLALDESHPFWATEEQPLSVAENIQVQREPGFLIQRLERGDHVVALSGKQSRGVSCGYSLSGFDAKYGKFAYSSRYGFSVSRNHYTLEQGAFDSMLALREKGDAYFHVRVDQELISLEKTWIHSRWKPWEDVVVDTYLIPVEGGHIRCHRIDSKRSLETAEGGFCLLRTPHDGNIRFENNPVTTKAGLAYAEDEESYSLIAGLLPVVRQAECVFPEANTNLVFSKTILPTLRGEAAAGVTALCCAVYAGKKGTQPKTLPAVQIYQDEIVVQDGGKSIRIKL